jgi:hypothetical protein
MCARGARNDILHLYPETQMPALRRSLLSLILASAALLAACNEASTSAPGDDDGDGTFTAAAGTAFYADTVLTPAFGATMLPIDTAAYNGSTYVKQDTIGYRVLASALRYKKGDSTVSTIGFVEIGFGVKTPVSATYDVYGHDADPASPLRGLGGKARIFIFGVPGGLTYSSADSSAGEKVQVIVKGDSVQVLGEKIKLRHGREVSFNFTVKKAW